MSLRQTLIRILQSGESTLQVSDELQYLRIENQRLLGIIESLTIKFQTPRPPARAREAEDLGPYRVGRPVMTRTAMRKVAQAELNRINKEKENVVEDSGGRVDSGEADRA